MDNSVNFGSIYNMLFLINLLLQEKRTINNIQEEFNKQKIKASKTTINNYIKKLLKNNFNIEIEKIKNQNYYSIKIKDHKKEFDKKIIKPLYDLKKVIISKKNFTLIKNSLYLFYQISLLFEDKHKKTVANFGYFSLLNWHLICSLEKHCQNKDIIEIEYIKGDNKSKNIILQANKIDFRENSNRLYLICILENTKEFSHLPIDRIFQVKKVIKENALLQIEEKELIYTISKDLIEDFKLEKDETIIKRKDNKITIKRPVYNSFFVIQRLMQFCPHLYFVSDDEIKKSILDKLKILESIYEK